MAVETTDTILTEIRTLDEVVQDSATKLEEGRTIQRRSERTDAVSSLNEDEQARLITALKMARGLVTIARRIIATGLDRAVNPS
jgi:hypothetical protein